MKSFASFAAVLVALAAQPMYSQQVVDTTFVARVRSSPAYPTGRGPVVMIDEAHHNLHTATGRYRPFVKLVEGDVIYVRESLF